MKPSTSFILFGVSLLLFINNVWCQTLVVHNSARFGGRLDDIGTGISSLGSSAMFLSGNMESEETTFPTSPSSTVFNSKNSDGFLAKLDQNTAVQWVKHITGAGDERIHTNEVRSGDSRVFVGGEFTSPTIILGGANHTNWGSSDGFISSYNTNTGAFQSSYQIGGTGADTVHMVDVGSTTVSLFAVGSYSSPTLYLRNSSNMESMTTLIEGQPLGSDAYFVNIVNNGLTYVTRFFSSGNDRAVGVISDNSNNAYVLGNFDDMIITLGNKIFNSTGSNSVFVAQIPALTSNVAWGVIGCHSSGGSIFGEGIAFDKTNNHLYVGGSLRYSMAEFRFGDVVIKDTAMNTRFLVKLSNLGMVIWATSYGGVNNNMGRVSVEVDTTGTIYVAGCVDATNATFFVNETVTPNATQVWPNRGSDDTFFILVDPQQGDVSWAVTNGGSGSDCTRALTFNDNLYTAGSTSSPADSFWKTGADLSFMNANDIFVTQYTGSENSCLSSPCLNGGTCLPGVYGYSCSCTDPHKGTRCELVNYCLSNPCQHGGLCSANEAGGNFTCFCTVGYEGATCSNAVTTQVNNVVTEDNTKVVALAAAVGVTSFGVIVGVIYGIMRCRK